MECIRNKIVKVRKEQHCVGCNRKFPKGTEMEVLTWVDDDIHDDYWCKTCSEYWFKYGEPGEEFETGTLKSNGEKRWEEIRKEFEGDIK